ncbi:MAG TPA: carboxymuconolactone decarboxylase family protein [Anaerolineales bacterium]|nr:carboxymuconolactone decarboxylase family protein [Anaerolineales bacterium]|tara:strand:+ start:184 stop:621 length:438 start_codon:yes stop_codon:yes gene_type:complete
MESRISIGDLEPLAIEAMRGLGKYLGAAKLNVSLCGLIKIRASQINGCAYCIQLHSEEARTQGETEQRIYALSAWKESPLFTSEERAILALTEEVTMISDHGLSKEVYDRSLQLFGDHGLAQYIVQIITVNAWNRIALSTRMRHE